MTETRLPPIDVMLPVAPKEMATLPLAIESLRRHSLNPIETVHVVGAATLRELVPGNVAEDVRWVNDESIRPGQQEVRAVLDKIGYPHNNGSWYFQQLLKLGVFATLNTSAEHILAMDTDFTFVTDTEFVDARGRAWLANGYPLTWHPGVQDHAIPEDHTALSSASRLVPQWQPLDGYSGMQHHMIFDRVIIDGLSSLVEEHHDMELWQAALHSVDRKKWTGLSEYVIYRHFAQNNFPERVRARNISTIDVIQDAQASPYSLKDVVEAYKRPGVQAVGCHQFRDYRGAFMNMDYVPDYLRQRLAATTALALDLHEGILHFTPLDPHLMPAHSLDLRTTRLL